MLPKGLLKEYSSALAMLLRCLDMLAVLMAAYLAYFMRFHTVILPSSYLAALGIALFLTPLLFSFFSIYEAVRGKGFFQYFMRLIQAVSVLGLILAGLSFFTKSGDAFSRTWFMLWIAFTLLFLFVLRFNLYFSLRFMRSCGLNERRVVILGAGVLGAKLAETVQQAMWTGFRIVTFIDDEAASKPAAIHGILIQATPERLSDFLQAQAIDEIWLALPLRAEKRVKEILHELRHHTITTRFVLDIFGLDLLNHSLTDIAGFPVLNISSTPMVGINRLIKACEDRILAAVILLLVSPLFLFLALAVKCSSKGPVFFKQQRLGWDGRIIKVYKFRTMFVHAEDQGRVTQASADDQRVTTIGRWLRRCSLDELPQFINVLQGRMSIVGPRPHALAHNELYKESVHTYMQRHRVKPGITGWAQINGWRGEIDHLDKMQKRVEYDLFYINNWSLAFDIKIILLTLLKGFTHPNAY